ncbi:MAG: methionine--tRNA ligase [Candidatus Roizmanbacteria bacterium]|nr:methionine--tRNA ligase [Candidatus Roizmanbacteria bacterium]
MTSNKKYITTTLPYVNSDPHIGFALEIVQADVIARTWRQLGNEVVFNTGTDEHGQKIYQKAMERKQDPQQYCDEYAKKFNDLKEALNLSYTHFIRTTDKNHVLAAAEFWNRCLKNGDIYKKNYQTKYCVGCELEKTDSDLVNGQCPLHPKNVIELRDEENYFFAFSKFQKPLLELYQKQPDFVLPESKFNEIKQFVAGGLQDFSISRLKEKMPWGIPVPNDPDHVMYVWFDALINYISTVSWPDEKLWKDWWPGIQVAGKDNLRQQSAMWQAMLLSAGVPLSKQIIIHGFITSNGQKMSKSLGNVVDPYEMIKKYGTDAVRYYLLREIPTLDDGDFSELRMKELYNSDLANELGNCVSRVTTLAANDGIEVEKKPYSINTEHAKQIEKFHMNDALLSIWEEVKKLNKKINEQTPWSKTPAERHDFLVESLSVLFEIGNRLYPFMPKTSEMILAGTSGKIAKVPPLFPRLSK